MWEMNKVKYYFNKIVSKFKIGCMVILFILTGYMICKCFKFWKSVAKNV